MPGQLHCSMHAAHIMHVVRPTCTMPHSREHLASPIPTDSCKSSLFHLPRRQCWRVQPRCSWFAPWLDGACLRQESPAAMPWSGESAARRGARGGPGGQQRVLRAARGRACLRRRCLPRRLSAARPGSRRCPSCPLLRRLQVGACAAGSARSDCGILGVHDRMHIIPSPWMAVSNSWHIVHAWHSSRLRKTSCPGSCKICSAWRVACLGLQAARDFCTRSDRERSSYRCTWICWRCCQLNAQSALQPPADALGVPPAFQHLPAGMKLKELTLTL